MGQNVNFYSFPQLILLTVIVLRYFPYPAPDSLLWVQYCHRDYQFCPKCFERNASQGNWLKNLKSITKEFNINSIFGTRKVQRALWSYGDEGQSENVVMKYFSNDDILDDFMYKFCKHASMYLEKDATNDSNCASMWKSASQSNELSEVLRRIYNKKKSYLNTRLCPDHSEHFLRIFNQFTNNATFWIQLWINPELVILKAIQSSDNLALKNAVPRLVDWCGFAFVVEDTGRTTLLDFYENSFRERIYLAKQLLEIAIAFSYGIDGFRIYLTDATPDNIVAHKSTLRVTLVDLDSLLIVDSNVIKTNNINRYQQIVDCNHCFAFIPEELCSHHLSDINIFSVCQIFLNDSFAGFGSSTGKGLLHSIPKYIELTFSLNHLLVQCLNCDKQRSCLNRFLVSNLLISAFTKITDVLNLQEF